MVQWCVCVCVCVFVLYCIVLHCIQGSSQVKIVEGGGAWETVTLYPIFHFPIFSCHAKCNVWGESLTSPQTNVIIITHGMEGIMADLCPSA